MSQNETPNSEITPSSEIMPTPTETTLPVPVPVTDTPPPAAPAPAASGKRPAGVTIIALLSLLQGFLGACVACLILSLGTGAALIPTGVTQVVGGLAIVLGLIMGAGPFLQLIFAYGAWNLRTWAWWFGILVTGVSVAGVVISIIGSGGATIWSAVTNALIPIVIFVYLLLPNVRKSFNR